MRFLLSLLTAAALFTAAGAQAHDYKIGDIQIEHPWTRATPPSARTGGGYVTLTNGGGAPDRLVGAASPVAGRAEIHSMTMDGNVMRMRELTGGLVLPPGQTVELKPGGLHIMFIDLKQPIEKDQKVPVTLIFEKAGSVDVEMPAAAIGASGTGGHGVMDGHMGGQTGGK